jgi:hypothetical protein
LLALAAAASLASVAAIQLRRLHRLAARASRAPIAVTDGRIRTLLESTAGIWLRLAAVTALAYLLQENLERAIAGAGPLPGLGVVGGDHQAVIPILAFVTFAIAVVAGLYRWRREVLLAVARAAARRRRSTIAMGRPTPPRATVTPATAFVRRNGLRAPPSRLPAQP